MGERSGRSRAWRSHRLCAVGVLAVAGLPLSGCSESGPTASSSTYEPARLEPVGGTDRKRVSFTAEAARRVGLRTAPVRRDGRRTVVPYEAVLYSAEGETFVYRAATPLSFVREEIQVDRIDGGAALLLHGPAVGDQVVTVGAAEVYGSEFEVGH